MSLQCRELRTEGQRLTIPPGPSRLYLRPRGVDLKLQEERDSDSRKRPRLRPRGASLRMQQEKGRDGPRGER